MYFALLFAGMVGMQFVCATSAAVFKSCSRYISNFVVLVCSFKTLFTTQVGASSPYAMKVSYENAGLGVEPHVMG